MNKISKKIVALATMAAFVLTLVPAAAFAATADVDPLKSFVQTVEKNETVNIGDKVVFEANLYNEDKEEITDDANAIYFWVEDENGNVVNDVDYYGSPEAEDPVGNDKAIWLGEDKVFYTTQTSTGGDRAVAINKAGNFVIKAGVNKLASAPTSVKDLAKLQNKKDYTNITVAVPAIDGLVIRDQNGTVLTPDATDTVKLDLTNDEIRDGFRFNGSDTYTLTGTALDEDRDPIANKTLTLSTSEGTVVEFEGGNTVTTDAEGNFEVVFSMQSQKNCTITIANAEEGIDYTVRVVAVTTTAVNIDRTLENGYVLAGDDDYWTDSQRDFSNAVQFEITNEKNDPVTGPLTGEPAYTDEMGNTGADHDKYVRIMSKPDDSDITANDLGLYWDGSVYTLRYIGAYASRVDDLVPGQYTVRVSLLSDDNATVTFNVDNFGTVKDTVLDIEATDMSTLGDRVVDIDDEITLGQLVNVTAGYVDENGIVIDANADFAVRDFGELVIGANGEAVIDASAGDLGYTFATKTDVQANESLLGTTITVYAQNTATKQLVTRELTVVKSYNAFTLEFDPAEGPVNEDNRVTVNVVKEDGTRAQVDGTLYAYIADQSNEDAKVSLEVVGNGQNVDDGKGYINVYADAETTADIVVAVKDAHNDGLYAATLEYTFGQADPLASRTVVMTIDSVDYVVNNNVITGDAAPYVDDNWRTMVPIRALAEAFDAEVVWDQDDETVTINFDGGTQIVMTVGETTYTINGEEATMDTEPVNTGSRVYVPIRFAAEGLGFSVTPLYNADGLTASVVFQR